MAKKVIFLAILGFSLGVVFTKFINQVNSKNNKVQASNCVEKIYACEKGGSCGAHTINVC